MSTCTQPPAAANHAEGAASNAASAPARRYRTAVLRRAGFIAERQGDRGLCLFQESLRSYFPHSDTVLTDLGQELDLYDCDKGTLRFPIDEPLPRELLARLVEVRLSQLGLA